MITFYRVILSSNRTLSRASHLHHGNCSRQSTLYSVVNVQLY
nr:MAG TPA: hypothetical protein [Caudoviricetes sp.]